MRVYVVGRELTDQLWSIVDRLSTKIDRLVPIYAGVIDKNENLRLYYSIIRCY